MTMATAMSSLSTAETHLRQAIKLVERGYANTVTFPNFHEGIIHSLRRLSVMQTQFEEANALLPQGQHPALPELPQDEVPEE